MDTRALPTGGRRRALRLWLVAILALFIGAPASGQEEATEPVAEIVATVGPTSLTRGDLDRVMRRMSGGKAVPADQQQRFQGQALAELVEQTLIRAEVERRKVEVTDAEIDGRVAQLSAEFAGRNSSLESFLSASGMDHDDLRDQVRLEIAIPKLIAPLITEDVMKQVFDMHHFDFDGTRIRASHIIIRPEASAGPDAIKSLLARAERIRADILAEEITFAEAAQRYSAGPSRHRGGDLGFFPRHGLFSEEFSGEVFRLTKGEISKPFLTPSGVHVVKVTDIDPGTIEAETFRQPLEQLAFKKVLQQFLAFLRQRTPIDIKPGIIAADPRP